MAGISDHGKAFSTPSGKTRLLIVEARFHEALADALLAGARAALDSAGATYDVITVPGALEIPGVISMAVDAADESGTYYDGFVALGAVIRGETYHFEIVSNESARGITDVQLATGVPIANGVLPTEDDDQALARMVQKGMEAGQAAVEMANLQRFIWK